MEALTDLKHILHSKRANIYLYQGACPRIINLLQKSWICAVSRFFSSNSGAILLKKPKNSPKTSFPSLRFLFSDKLLEKCRLLQKGGRVVYLTEETKSKHYWNIPIANTTVILLGTGTSITQGAVRMLCSAGVLFGFSGGGGTPLLASNEIEWMTPQSEYRPTEYIQSWMKFWFDANKRLKVAKYVQKQRINYLQTTWKKDQDLKLEGFDIKHEELKTTDFEPEHTGKLNFYIKAVDRIIRNKEDKATIGIILCKTKIN